MRGQGGTRTPISRVTILAHQPLVLPVQMLDCPWGDDDFREM